MGDLAGIDNLKVSMIYATWLFEIQSLTRVLNILQELVTRSPGLEYAREIPGNLLNRVNRQDMKKPIRDGLDNL